MMHHLVPQQKKKRMITYLTLAALKAIEIPFAQSNIPYKAIRFSFKYKWKRSNVKLFCFTPYKLN